MNAQVKIVLLPEKPKKLLRFCSFYRKGECKFGDKCFYVHDSRIQIPCPFRDCKFGTMCWYTHDEDAQEQSNNPKANTQHSSQKTCCTSTEIKTKLVAIETAIEDIKQDLQKIDQQYCKVFSFNVLQEKIQYLETSIKQHNDQINTLKQALNTHNETPSLKMVQISDGVYELTPPKKKPMHNIRESKGRSLPVPSPLSTEQPKDESKSIRDSDANDVEIVVKKTSQPLGLLLRVYDEENGVFIDDIVNIEKSPFNIGDQLIKINEVQLASLQDLMDIVGSTKIGEDLHFQVKRPKLNKKKQK